jgi:hypothetical protein
LAGEKFFILRVHHPVLGMETLTVVPLVTVSLMMMIPFLSISTWFVDLT